MTEAELETLCKNHGIPPEDAENGLHELEKLTERRPTGIGLPGENVGDLMEAAAHLHHVLRDREVPTFQRAGDVFALAIEEMIGVVRRRAGVGD